MKSATISLITAVICVIMVIFLFIKISGLHQRIDDLEQHNLQLTAVNQDTTSHAEENEEAGEENIEILHYMMRLQSIHSKLYFAGTSNNTELMKFYVEELEEEFEHIVKADVFDEGINISKNAQLFGINAVHKFEEEMYNPDFNFKNSFQQITNSCNSCHQASKHPFIRITEPTSPSFTNQNFSKDL